MTAFERLPSTTGCVCFDSLGGCEPLALVSLGSWPCQNARACGTHRMTFFPCIMVWVFGPPHTRMWHDASCTNPQLPSDLSSPDTIKCAVVRQQAPRRRTHSYPRH